MHSKILARMTLYLVASPPSQLRRKGRPHARTRSTSSCTMARPVLLALVVLFCLCQTASSNFIGEVVFDAFTFEGVVQDFEVQVLELRVQAALGEARPWNGWRYFNNDKKWVKYFLKVEISPMNGKILVDALWQRNDNLERGVLFRE
eukprot:928356-Rhodomonas_salina.1